MDLLLRIDPNFEQIMGKKLAEMVVSHRAKHKVSGELHKGSNYGKPFFYNGKSTIHSRYAVYALSAADIEADDVIVDGAVRDAVRARLEEVGGNLKAFEKSANLPYLVSPSGKNTPIKKVRTCETKKPLQVGSGCASGLLLQVEFIMWNYSSAVTKLAGRPGTVGWFSAPRPTNADEGSSRSSPVRLKALPSPPSFSLSNDDTIEIDTTEGRRIMRIKKSGENKQIFYVPVNDAHTDADQSKYGIVKSKYPNTPKPLNPRKVVVDLLGRVHTAND